MCMRLGLRCCEEQARPQLARVLPGVPGCPGYHPAYARVYGVRASEIPLTCEFVIPTRSACVGMKAAHSQKPHSFMSTSRTQGAMGHGRSKRHVEARLDEA